MCYIYMNENFKKKNWQKLPCITIQDGQKYTNVWEVQVDWSSGLKTGVLKQAKKNYVRAWLEADMETILVKTTKRGRWKYFEDVQNVQR